MELIDTHQHLIYRETLGNGWTRGIPQLEKGDFTLGDYQALTAVKGIAGTVFMNARSTMPITGMRRGLSLG